MPPFQNVNYYYKQDHFLVFKEEKKLFPTKSLSQCSVRKKKSHFTKGAFFHLSLPSPSTGPFEFSNIVILYYMNRAGWFKNNVRIF